MLCINKIRLPDLSLGVIGLGSIYDNMSDAILYVCMCMDHSTMEMLDRVPPALFVSLSRLVSLYDRCYIL